MFSRRSVNTFWTSSGDDKGTVVSCFELKRCWGGERAGKRQLVGADFEEKVRKEKNETNPKAGWSPPSPFKLLSYSVEPVILLISSITTSFQLLASVPFIFSKNQKEQISLPWYTHCHGNQWAIGEPQGTQRRSAPRMFICIPSSKPPPANLHLQNPAGLFMLIMRFSPNPGQSHSLQVETPWKQPDTIFPVTRSRANLRLPEVARWCGYTVLCKYDSRYWPAAFAAQWY